MSNSFKNLDNIINTAQDTTSKVKKVEGLFAGVKNSSFSTLAISGIVVLVFLLLPTISNSLGDKFSSVGDTFKQVLGQSASKGEVQANVGVCKPLTKTSATVVRVVDGDTVELSNFCNNKIRLLYVDTPETVKPNTPVQCYGKEASDHTKKALKEGEKITVEFDKEVTDRYGRALGIVYKEGSDINNFLESYNYSLVKEGYAKAKFYSPNIAYKKDLIAIETIAKDANRGLWKECQL